MVRTLITGAAQSVTEIARKKAEAAKSQPPRAAAKTASSDPTKKSGTKKTNRQKATSEFKSSKALR